MVGGEFRIREELPFLLDMMHKIYAHKSIQLELQEGLNEVQLDRDDLLELFGNLLDNACKFASQTIRLRIKQTDNMLVLCFEDDGPGVDAEMLNDIKIKGMRLDESVQGHGLGLSICADIIDSYQGRLEFGRSDLGGLRVEVSLPLN